MTSSHRDGLYSPTSLQYYEVLLDLMLTNTEDISKDVKTEGSLDYSNHALVDFVIIKNRSLSKSEVRTLTFKRANFRLFLFKELLDKFAWEADKGVEQR